LNIKKSIPLFVYGTLQPGRPNAHVLESIGGSWKKASVRGRLKYEGWGAELGYPALILKPDGEKVEGFVFISDSLSTHWNVLDEFEGQEYKRILTLATLEDGSETEAHIYVLNENRRSQA
jgi:gamma-glutamylcyclotransferase (GGCT)/AIG2-like uncharacterized protein YtfP